MHWGLENWGQATWGWASEIDEMPEPYLTVEDAEILVTEFHLTEDRQCWVEATEEDKYTALSLATRDIDKLNFAGSKADSSQLRQFPRGTDTETPQAILNACILIAVARLDGKRPEEEVENQGLMSTGYASVRSTYDRTSVPEHMSAGIVSFEAWQELRPFLRDPSTFKQSRV